MELTERHTQNGTKVKLQRIVSNTASSPAAERRAELSRHEHRTRAGLNPQEHPDWHSGGLEEPIGDEGGGTSTGGLKTHQSPAGHHKAQHA